MVWQKRWKIWFLIGGAVIILGIVYYSGVTRVKKTESPSRYSVILYQDMDNEWVSLTNGIRQAEEDLKVKVNYITMEENASAGDQAELMKREIEAGASGILLAAGDSQGLWEELQDWTVSVPVICVETGVGGDIATIGADDYKMGKALGGRILKDMEEEQVPQESRIVTVITEYMERESVQDRYEGLKAVLSGSEKPVKIQEKARSEGDYSLKLFIGTAFADSGLYIAALDKYATEEAAAAWSSNKGAYEAQGEGFKIYGIGNTNQTVGALDTGTVQALVFQNEFNMGYEGLKALVENRKKDWIEKNISVKYKLVTKDTLYEYENERLLFPSI